MKKVRMIGLMLLVSLFALPVSTVSAVDLSEDVVASGLKEALKVGAESAVSLISQLDGFYKNDIIKILLPEKFQKAAEVMRKAGFDQLVDNFELSMNRAAEQAASSATDLIVGAVKEMTIEDAITILNGEDNQATLYFQEKTSEQLAEKFKPIIETTMSEVGVTSLYQEFEGKVKSLIPLGIGDMLEIDLSQYVTDKALDGLFYMLAEEERKIRENPEARITDLLEQVFK